MVGGIRVVCGVAGIDAVSPDSCEMGAIIVVACSRSELASGGLP